MGVAGQDTPSRTTAHLLPCRLLGPLLSLRLPASQGGQSEQSVLLLLVEGIKGWRHLKRRPADASAADQTAGCTAQASQLQGTTSQARARQDPA